MNSFLWKKSAGRANECGVGIRTPMAGANTQRQGVWASGFNAHTDDP